MSEDEQGNDNKRPVPIDEDDDKTLFRPRPDVAAEDADDKTLFQPRPAGAEGSMPPPLPPQDIAPLPTPRTASTLADRDAVISTGTTINNNYVLEGVLKSGGMGSVYRGSEIGTGDPVAIKAVLPELAEDTKAGQLFTLEARTLRQLSHPAIVRYYNYVHDRALDQYFLIMEYIEGSPLSDWIKAKGALPVDAVRTLMDRLAGGLAQAHEQGVIHRDLSPDNAMLPEGDVARARLIDFGISLSKTLSDASAESEFAGKYKYVAPEQLSGEGIGPAADIYGLALMMTAAATGHPLDMGSGPEAAVAARQSIPDLEHVPDALRPLIAHMLEPDPAMRPSSMQDVRRMLQTPSLIPARYGGVVPPEPPEALVPQGLQLPQVQTKAAPAAVPLPPISVDEPEAARGGNRALVLLLGAFLIVSAAVGVGAWQMGMIGGADETPALATQSDTAPAQTRGAFLADYPAGPCTHLARVRTGQNTGMIEAFSQAGSTFPDLPDEYAAQFGARPAVLPRRITASQCAALSFVDALHSEEATPPVVVKSADQIASGDAFGVRIGGTGDKAVWAALITPKGELFNLTKHLSEAAGGQRGLEFRLQLAEGSAAVPQLVLIVASHAPLVRAATAPDGDRAAEVLPKVLEEIRAAGPGTSATLEYVLLRPVNDDDPI